MSSNEFDEQKDRASEEEVLEGEELLDGEEQEEQEEKDDKEPNGAIGWFISIGMHALFALIFYYAVFAAKEKDQELPPMRVTTIDPPPKKEDKKDLERTIDNKVEINVATEADVAAPINNLEVPVEEKTETEEDTEAEVNKGREEAVASSEMGSTGAFMAIGAGGGAAGMFGNRSGGGKRRALVKGGGSRASESAVDAALRWFKRHQSPNGMWDTEKYPVNCTETPKCEPGGNANEHGSDANVACTGYAVLCFLGAGYDHKTPNKYKTTVEKGLEYLRSIQTAEGELGPRNYEHAVATMAMAEAYAMTNDLELKQPAQKGLNILMERQAKDGKGDSGGGLGWNYKGATPSRNDSSVTGWCVMALKAGLGGGLNVGNSMEGAKNWLEKAWKASNPDWQKLNDPYTAMSGFPYCYDAVADKIDEHGSGRMCMGALCAVFLGHHSGDIMLDSMINAIMAKNFVKGYPTNTYYMYYNTLAVFQAGGPHWEKWNGTCRDVIVNAQRKGDGCFDGSWDPQGTGVSEKIGRVLNTAFCCLSLEVYYRYKQVGAKVPPAK